MQPIDTLLLLQYKSAMRQKWVFIVILMTAFVACSANPGQPTSTGIITETPSTSTGTGNSSISSATPSPTPQPEERLQKGEQALFNGDYLQAEIQFQSALDASNDPEVTAAALWGLGRVESHGGNKAKALSDLKTLAENFPDTDNAARAYYVLGTIYSELGRYSEAVEAYTNYLEKRPDILEYYVQDILGDT